MHTYVRQSIVIYTVLLSAVLQGCAQNPSYAPVTEHSQSISNDNKNTAQNKSDIEITDNTPLEPEFDPLTNNDPSKSDINTTEPTPYPTTQQEDSEYHTVKTGETLYSIGTHSGYNYQNLAQWNQLYAPYAVKTGQKIKLFSSNTDNIYNVHFTKHTHSTHKHRNTKKNPFISDTKNTELPPPPKTKKKHRTTTKPDTPPLKTATISIDNKKMLKLAFGWPIKGSIVKNFRQSRNKGIEIAGKIGQQVVASEAGKVVYGGLWLVGFGNLLVIKHDALYLSAYANNSRLFVREGQNVRKGQVVAQVGRALSRRAALHFEIRKNGKSVNPLRLLPNS